MSVAQIENGPPGRETWDALMRRPTIYLPVSALTTTAKLFRGTGILIGGAIADAAQGAGAFALIDGEETASPHIADVSWPAGGSGMLAVGDFGPIFRNGLFIQRLAGTLQGAVWIKF